jgi:hypothetical protein
MMINYKLQIGHERKLRQFASRVYPTHILVKFCSHTLSVIGDGGGWPMCKELVNCGSNTFHDLLLSINNNLLVRIAHHKTL